MQRSAVSGTECQILQNIVLNMVIMNNSLSLLCLVALVWAQEDGTQAALIFVCKNSDPFAAILITGGNGFGEDPSAEVFRPSTSSSCLLPRMVVARSAHTLDTFLICGGEASQAWTSCEQFSPATGTWALTNHTLQEKRETHVSWTVEEGTILMGGVWGAGRRSEIVRHDGTTERTFFLRHNIM